MSDVLKNAIDRWSRAYEKQVIFKREYVSGLLHYLVELDEVDNVSRYQLLLPPDISQELAQFFSEIRTKDYRWRPFLIGPPLTDAEREAEYCRFQPALRRIDEILFPIALVK